MKDDTILLIDSVSKSFTRSSFLPQSRKAPDRVKVIDDLNLVVPYGKITALIGGNGAGKTTLFNIISGFVDADSGSVKLRVHGEAEELVGRPPHEIARLGVGRMFQDNHVFADLTVLENMLIADGGRIGEGPLVSLFSFRKIGATEKDRAEKAKGILEELFGPTNAFWRTKDQKSSSLSYGEQRLLGMARLLMGNHKILLLDEPTSGVNPAFANRIVQTVRAMVSTTELTVLLIEHNMKVVLELADFCSFMSRGKISAFGTPEDVIGNAEVRRLYLGV